MFTDAEEDYGGFIASRLSDINFCSKFSQNEKQTSLKYRESFAVKYVWPSFGYIGSSKTCLQNIPINMFKFFSAYNIKLIPQWIPCEQNELADHYSRTNDKENWTIDDGSFELICNLYGTFAIDRFADNFNHKVEKFIFKYYCPGTFQVNTFTAT